MRRTLVILSLCFTAACAIATGPEVGGEFDADAKATSPGKAHTWFWAQTDDKDCGSYGEGYCGCLLSEADEKHPCPGWVSPPLTENVVCYGEHFNVHSMHCYGNGENPGLHKGWEEQNCRNCAGGGSVTCEDVAVDVFCDYDEDDYYYFYGNTDEFLDPNSVPSCMACNDPESCTVMDEECVMVGEGEPDPGFGIDCDDADPFATC